MGRPWTSNRAAGKAPRLANGFRSGLEKRIADDLKSKGIPFEYEKLKIEYTVPAREAKYTPDFVMLSNGIIVEAKGKSSSISTLWSAYQAVQAMPSMTSNVTSSGYVSSTRSFSCSMTTIRDATQVVWKGDLNATVVRWDSHARGHCTGIRWSRTGGQEPKYWIDITWDGGTGQPRLTDWGDSFANFYERVSDHADAAALNFGSVVNYDDRGLRFQGGTRHIKITQPASASNRRVFRLAEYTYDYSDSGAGVFSEHILVDITGAGSLLLDLAPTRCEGNAAMAGPNPAFVRVTDTQGPDNIGTEAVTLIYHGAGIDHSGATGCWLVYQETTQTGSGAPHTNIYLPYGAYLLNFQGLQGGNWNATHKGLEPTFATATTLPPYSSGRVASGMFPYLGRNPRFKGTIEGDSGVQFLVGTGNPEGSRSAAKGSLFHRTDGNAGFTLYLKTSGTQVSPTNTGWYNLSMQRSGATIASPSADVASLKTAVDAIRSALTASGLTN